MAPALRDDCGQNTLLRIWRARESYRGSSIDELAAWMHRICQREHLRLLDAHRRRDDPGGSDDAGAEEPADSASERTDTRRALERCIAHLEERERAAVELLYSVEAPGERGVATVLGVSKSYVNVLRQRAIGKLRLCLRGKGVTA